MVVVEVSAALHIFRHGYTCSVRLHVGIWDLRESEAKV